MIVCLDSSFVLASFVIKNPSTITELVETIFNLIMLLRKIYSKRLQIFIERFGIEIESTRINEESDLTEQ